LFLHRSGDFLNRLPRAVRELNWPRGSGVLSPFGPNPRRNASFFSRQLYVRS
jgi:hypothetical protein